MSLHGTTPPPRFAAWLLRRSVPADEREALLGDLEEECRALGFSGWRAGGWYGWQALALSARLSAWRLWRRAAGWAARRAIPRAPRRKEREPMAQLAQDLRHGLRVLARKPIYAAAAVLTLALGIGANAAVFSVVYAVLLHPLPYSEPDRVVALWQTDARKPGERILASPANFLDWRALVGDGPREVEAQPQHRRHHGHGEGQGAAAAFEALAAVSPWALEYTGGEEPESIDAALVSEGYFRALGVKPLLGRTFQPADHQAGGEAVLLLTHGLWQERFGGDPAVVGRTLTFSERPYTVVGVLPPEFRSPFYSGRLYGPLVFWPGAEEARLATYLGVVGRLAPGTGLRQAEAALAGACARIAAENPREAAGLGAHLSPVRERIVGSVRPALLTLSGAAAAILLLACANVAALQLARATERQREFAIRSALGAARRRLVRQLLTESFWLVLFASALGGVLAYWGTDLLRSLAPSTIPRLDLVRLNAPVLGFGAAAALATLLVFGLAPALRASRPELQPALRQGAGAVSAGRHTHRLGNALVAWEVALALVLLTGAGLLARSFVALVRVDPGFNPENVLSLQVFIYGRYPTPEAQAAYFQQALERLGATPGVEAAGVVSAQPFLFGAPTSLPLSADDAPPPPPGQEPTALSTVAGGEYFRAEGIPLLRGRTFDDRDRPDSTPVAVVSESMARRFWPGEDPIGKTFTLHQTPPRRLEVAGVVGDVRNASLDETPQPQFYRALAQAPTGGMSFVVRTRSEAAALLPAVKEAIWSVNSQQPFYRTLTVEGLIQRSLGQRRFLLVLLGTFAGLALALATVGIYGVVSFLTARRTREIGLRLAQGARPAQILRLVMRQGVGVAAVGVAVGLLGAAALSRLLGSLLFAVSPLDPVAYSATAALLLAVALAASYLPARRAMRVDPIEVLREE